MINALNWAFTAFFIAYLLNACGESFDPEENASSQSSSVPNLTQEDDPAAITFIPYTSGNSSSSSTTSGGGFVGGSVGSSTGSTSGSSGGSSSYGGTGGYASGGGTLDQGSDSSSSVSTITYDDYNSSGFLYFEKMTEPESTYTSEGEAFALQFVAIGKFPLKYTWYKEGTAGKSLVGTDSTVFSKVSASTSDAGVYYAIVEDAEGNILTSQKATLSVRPSDKACLDGRYGMTNSNYEELVIESYVPSQYTYSLIQIPYMRGSYTYELNCNVFKASIIYSCTGKLTYQCVDGKYKKIDGSCYCSDGGG